MQLSAFFAFLLFLPFRNLGSQAGKEREKVRVLESDTFTCYLLFLCLVGHPFVIFPRGTPPPSPC